MRQDWAGSTNCGSGPRNLSPVSSRRSASSRRALTPFSGHCYRLCLVTIRLFLTQLLIVFSSLGCVLVSSGPAAPTSVSPDSRPTIPAPVLDRTGLLDHIHHLVRDADIVGLGETHHGTATFHIAASRITRDLVSRGGVRAIALETPWASALQTTDFVRTCDGDPLAAVSKLAPHYRSTELADFVAWVCHRNQLNPHDPVVIFGIDSAAPFHSWTVFKESMARVLSAGEESALRSLLEPCDGVVHDSAEAYMALGYRGARRRPFPTRRHKACDESLDSAWSTLTRHHDALTGAERAFASIALRDLRTWNDKLATGHDPKTLAILDDTEMFENLTTFRDLYAPAERVIIWSHLSHLAFDHRAIKTRLPTAGAVLMGTHLRREYGHAYMVVGITASHVRSFWPRKLLTFSAPRGALERSISYDVAPERSAVIDLRRYAPTILDKGGRSSAGRPVWFAVGRNMMHPESQMDAVFWFKEAHEITLVPGASRDDHLGPSPSALRRILR